MKRGDSLSVCFTGRDGVEYVALVRMIHPPYNPGRYNKDGSWADPPEGPEWDIFKIVRDSDGYILPQEMWAYALDEGIEEGIYSDATSEIEQHDKDQEAAEADRNWDLRRDK
jgi:hypothetical protein